MARRIDLHCGDLYQAYVVEGLTTYEVAEEFECSQTCVVRNLKSCGIQSRSKTDHLIGKKRPKHAKHMKYLWESGVYDSRNDANIKGDNHWRYSGGAVLLGYCSVCRKPMKDTISRLGKRYCSIQCFCDARNINGSNNPNWRGGVSFEPYPETFNKSFKKRIRNRDKVCALCDAVHSFKVGSKYWKLCVHHIDYNKNNTTMSNCITLCHSCNSKVNSNRNYWESHFKELLHERYGYDYATRND